MIAYINRIKNKEPRSVDSEPRSNYADGLKVDPVADSAKKISQVLGAYKRYRRGEKNPVINFSKFFEMWARENFADGQLVRNTVDGSRPGYGGLTDAQKKNGQKYEVRKGNMNTGVGDFRPSGVDNAAYRPLSKEGEKIAKHVYGTVDVSFRQRQRINSGEITMDTVPVKMNKETDILKD